MLLLRAASISLKYGQYWGFEQFVVVVLNALSIVDLFTVLRCVAKCWLDGWTFLTHLLKYLFPNFLWLWIISSKWRWKRSSPNTDLRYNVSFLAQCLVFFELGAIFWIAAAVSTCVVVVGGSSVWQVHLGTDQTYYQTPSVIFFYFFWGGEPYPMRIVH